MEILQLVDQLEQVLNRGWRVPFTSSLIVNEEECLRLIDQMRISVPSAIKESERMIAERDRILNDARMQAEATLSHAEQEAMEMVRQHYVVEEAHREADRIRAMGREEAMRLIQDAEEYALNVLRQLNTRLDSAMREAHNGIRAIEESRSPDVIEPELDNVEPAVFEADPEPDDREPEEDREDESTDEKI